MSRHPGSDVASYRRFRVQHGKYPGVAPLGLVVGDILDCNWRCEGCWSKFGWANAPDKPLVLSPSQVAQRLIRPGMAARISGGEPTMNWQHIVGVARVFLREHDQVLILETNGSMLTEQRLLELDALDEAERIVLSIGVKATTPELLADLTGMTAKTAERMHADQYAALRFVATECDHLNFGATFLDRYTDPAGFADLILEAEGWRGGPGRLGISVFRQYGDANAFYVPKRMREPDAGRQSEEADEAGRG